MELVWLFFLFLFGGTVACALGADDPWAAVSNALTKADKIVISGTVQKTLDAPIEKINSALTSNDGLQFFSDRFRSFDVVYVGRKYTEANVLQDEKHLKIFVYRGGKLSATFFLASSVKIVLGDGTGLYIDSEWNYGEFVRYLIRHGTPLDK